MFLQIIKDIPYILAFASFFEWALHGLVMHKNLLLFPYPFKSHAMIHHKKFKADHTYHVVNESDKRLIPMAWWNCIVLILIAEIITLPFAYFFGRWEIMFTVIFVFGLYYGAYEYMHWCMHLPKARRLERSWIFRRLNGHHLLHHRYMHKNFNVVLPLADLFLGTLMLRSKVTFAQARGPSVPDVQPN